MRTITKKPFLLGMLAALLILALCAVPLLAGSPAYANDKASGGGRASTAGTKASSDNSKAQQGKSVETVVELDYGVLCIPGSGHCFSATISPTSLTYGVDSFHDVLFTLTYTNCSGTNAEHSSRLGYFETEVPDAFTDIAVQSTTAYRQYSDVSATWYSWYSSGRVKSTVGTDSNSTLAEWEANAIYGNSDPNKAGRVIVTFTADVPECIVELDIDPDDGSTVTAGEAFEFEVTAKDGSGDGRWNSYPGTVYFSSTDGEPYPADLPDPSTLPDGEKDFWATLYTAGPQSITVSDPNNYCWDFDFESKAKKQTWHDGYKDNDYWNYPEWDYNQVDPDGCGPLPVEPEVTVCAPICPFTYEFDVEPGCATTLDLTPDGGNLAEPGVPFDITVTLYDNWENPVTHYAGTVSFSSDHVGALLPGAYPFVPPHLGFQTFSGVTLYDFGTWTIMVTGTGYQYNCHEECVGREWVCDGCCHGYCWGHYEYTYETVCDECEPPAPDDENWTLEEPEEPEEPEEVIEEPLIEGAAPGLPVLVVDVQGTVARYPVTLGGELLVDAMTTSPDGLITLFIPSGCPVLNPDGTPAYLNRDPDVFSIVAADLTAPAGATLLAAYRLQPEGVIFSCDANIIVQYDPNTLPAGTTPVIAAYNAATGQWTDLETAGYVAGGVEVPNTLQANTSNALYFAILAK